MFWVGKNKINSLALHLQKQNNECDSTNHNIGAGDYSYNKSVPSGNSLELSEIGHHKSYEKSGHTKTGTFAVEEWLPFQ